MKTVPSTCFFSIESSASFNTHFHRKLASLISSLVYVLLFACALYFGAMSKASAATVYVNFNTPTPYNGDGASWPTALSTIEAGINTATSLATATPGTTIDIWVAGGTYPMSSCYRSLPNNVNIYGGFAGNEVQLSQRPFTGNLPTIQSVLTEPPYNSCQLFRTIGTTNTFNGVKFMAIGGILQNGGKLTVVSSTFTRSSAQATVLGGGGIAAYNGATLLVDKSLFQNLIASVGGAIAGLNAASVTVTNSTFSGNSALGAQYWSTTTNSVASLSGGGAINVDGNFQYDYYDYGAPVNNTQVTLGGNTFTYNTASWPLGGGAIHVEDSDTVSITNSTFGALDINGIPIPDSRNQAITDPYLGASNGGAISLSSSNRVTLNRNNFYGNAAYTGGAIYSEAQKINGSVSITASKFIRNSASIGGAIADVNENASKTVTVDINTNTFTQNTVASGGKGPAIFYDNTQAKINSKTVTSAIDNALFNSNTNLLLSDISP